MGVDSLIKITNTYLKEDEKIIRKAYDYAEKYHKNQKRQSGEDYIIHPLNVAIILTTYKADVNVICASLLHDLVEDTDVTLEMIEKEFNSEIAHLVSGVTKIRNLDFNSIHEAKDANKRKILTSLTDDIRIFIIKLADRLHNMRTLQFKSEIKQIENAEETLSIYVPIADALGLYKFKTELEDLSFKYLNPEMFKSVREERKKYSLGAKEAMKDMLSRIDELLNSKTVPHQLKIRIKNIYGTYKRIKEGHSIDDIHDLIAFQIMVDTIDNCYITLGNVHALYHPAPNKVRDYIAVPKTNMYRSLHTTIFTPHEKLVQAQIRTFEMEEINRHGIAALWQRNNSSVSSSILMNNALRQNYEFIQTLSDINFAAESDEIFMSNIKSQILSEKIYIYASNGKVIELPIGSTLSYYLFTIKGYDFRKINTVLVNEVIVPFDYVLKTGDIVRVIFHKSLVKSINLNS